MKISKNKMIKGLMLGVTATMATQPLLTTIANAQDLGAVETRTKSLQEKTIDIQGETVSYSIKNKANKKGTVVFVHGSIFNKDSMTPIAEAMNNQYQVVNIDLPGHGESTGLARTSVDDYADIVYATLQELVAKGEITDNITVAGWSLGGSIALNLATRDLPEIKNVVMISSSPDFNIPEIPAEYFDAKQIISMDFTDLTPEASKKFIFNQIDHNIAPVETSLLDLRVATEYKAVDKLKDIKIPVLILAGDKDTLALEDKQHLMDELIPTSTLRLYENRGHALVIEAPDKLAKDIKNFLK